MRERRRYANAAAPQPDLSITQCPGKGRSAHQVMTIGVNPATGYCVACTPPAPKASASPAKPAVNPAVESVTEVAASLETPPKVVLPSMTVQARPQVRRAREIDTWLLALIGEQTVPVAEIRQQAAERGWSWPQVKRAGQRVGVVSEKPAWTSGWLWRRMPV